jgi:alpha,alpha-trehalase
MLVESVTISRHNFDAALFDLDGVLTDSARVHAAAWKAVFRALRQRGADVVIKDLRAVHVEQN